MSSLKEAMTNDEIEQSLKVTVGQKPFTRSPVDIIIPFHGEIDKVARLVQSILLMTRSNPYQICLVDDASPNKDFYLQVKKVPQVVSMRNKEQLGFAGALQAGFMATKQPWVIFMHSDCVVEEPGWMINMGQSLLYLKDKGVRMVSAKSNNPGVSEPAQLTGKKSDTQEDYILQDGFLPFYCVMMHRDLFSHTGGFLKTYPYAMYEDEEFSYRMRHYKYKQAVCGNSWVYHEGGVTINALVAKKPNLVKVMESNREKCLEHIKKLRR